MKPEDTQASPSSQALEITIRDQQATTYDQWILETKGPYFDFVDRSAPLEWLRLESHHTVLDAGCGTGRLTIPIAERSREVWAIDFSPKSLEVVQRKAKEHGLANVKTIEADIAQSDLPSDYFDRAVSNGVLHHIPTAEARLHALRRIFESLKAGGSIVVMVFRWGGAVTYMKEYWTKTPYGELYRMGFTGEELRALLEEAGFRDVKVGGLFNFRPRGLSKLPFLLKIHAWLDLRLARCAWSAKTGKHLLASGRK